MDHLHTMQILFVSGQVNCIMIITDAQALLHSSIMLHVCVCLPQEISCLMLDFLPGSHAWPDTWQQEYLLDLRRQQQRAAVLTTLV